MSKDKNDIKINAQMSKNENSMKQKFCNEYERDIICTT